MSRPDKDTVPPPIATPQLYYAPAARGAVLVLHAKLRGVPVGRAYFRELEAVEYQEIAVCSDDESVESCAVPDRARIAIFIVSRVSVVGQQHLNRSTRIVVASLDDFAVRSVPAATAGEIGWLVGAAADGEVAYGIAYVTQEVAGRKWVVPALGTINLVTGVFSPTPMILQQGAY